MISSSANSIADMTRSRRPLTPIEKQAQQNLRAIWNAKKKELGLTQEIAAELMGWRSQGAVGAYLLGRVPLNTDAILKFSLLLDVDPREIDPSRPWHVVASKNWATGEESVRLVEGDAEGETSEPEAEPPLPGHARQLIQLIEKRALDGSLTKEHTAVLKSSLELMTGHKK